MKLNRRCTVLALAAAFVTTLGHGYTSDDSEPHAARDAHFDSISNPTQTGIESSRARTPDWFRLRPRIKAC